MWDGSDLPVFPMSRILIIEQDPDFAECLQSILKAEGFDVSWSRTVDEAVPDIRKARPEVAILDLHDGSAFKPEEIRRLSENEDNLKILVTANYRTPEVACKALGAGARDYLLKPFGTREILERVHSLAGTGKHNGDASHLEKIARSIHFLGSLDDVLRITLDQLASTLHMADCLIALEDDSAFTVVASRGYRPDPQSRTISISDASIASLAAGCDDPLALPSDLAREIVSELGVETSRPFPTIMPLVRQDRAHHPTGLMGFVLGHGGIVLDEHDILEMELFLTRIAREIAGLLDSNGTPVQHHKYDRQGEIIIPEIDRDEATNELLRQANPYLHHENDTFWIRLALDEAINNAIIHGHCETLDDIRKNIRLKYSIGPNRIVLTVEDTGEGFDHRNLPDPTADENLLSINGRGIFIMKSIMDEVVFNERGNQVSLVKKLDGKPLAPRDPGERTPELP